MMPTTLLGRNPRLLRTLQGGKILYSLDWRKCQYLPICQGYLLTVSLCAFAGTCESPIEHEQEADEFPGTPTNLPTHFSCFAMDSML